MEKTMLDYIKESKNAIYNQMNLGYDLVKPLVLKFLEHEYRKILIVASGSSYNSAMCAKNYMMDNIKLEVDVVSPYTFKNYYNNLNDEFIFVISQSGNSINAIEALDHLREKNIFTIGVTGNLDSEFKNHTDLLIDYGVEEESVGYVTKGVMTLIYFLDCFSLYAAFYSNKLSNEELESEINKIKLIIDNYDKTHEKVNKFVEDNFKDLSDMENVYVIGNYTAYGVALEGALKIGETVCVMSQALESEEFLHGPNLQLKPNYTVFVIDANDATSQRSRVIYDAVNEITDKVYLLSTQKTSNDKRHLDLGVKCEHNLLPFLYLQFFQIIAFRISEELNTWNKHPLFKKFKEKIKYKVK